MSEPARQLIGSGWVHVGNATDRSPFSRIGVPLAFFLVLPAVQPRGVSSGLRADWPRRADFLVAVHEVARVLGAAVRTVNFPIDADLRMRVQLGQLHRVVAVVTRDALHGIAFFGPGCLRLLGVRFARLCGLGLGFFGLLLLGLALILMQFEAADIDGLLALLALPLPAGIGKVGLHFELMNNRG